MILFSIKQEGCEECDCFRNGTMGRLGICDQVKHHNHEDDVGGDRMRALATLLSLQLDEQSSYIDYNFFLMGGPIIGLELSIYNFFAGSLTVSVLVNQLLEEIRTLGGAHPDCHC